MSRRCCVLQLAGDDYEVAPWWRRFLAFLIDNCIVSLGFQLVSGSAADSQAGTPLLSKS